MKLIFRGNEFTKSAHLEDKSSWNTSTLYVTKRMESKRENMSYFIY